MKICELCHEETRNRKRTTKRNELLCNRCREEAAQYDCMTPEEWAAEEAAIAAYSADHESEKF